MSIVNCGLFTAGFVMHILVGNFVLNHAFMQKGVTKLQHLLKKQEKAVFTLGALLLPDFYTAKCDNKKQAKWQ